MDSLPSLQLPGLGHSLWIDAGSAQASPAVSLPGSGFSIWPASSAQANPVVLAKPSVTLPGSGCSVWIDDSFPQASAPTSPAASKSSPVKAPCNAVKLPGEGHSLWKADQLVSSPLKLAGTSTLSTASKVADSPSGISLPGNGFSKWCHPGRDTESVRLPGKSHTLWTQPYLSAPKKTSTSNTTASPFSTSPHQPSRLANIMKSFGLIQLIGLLLIIALLLGFLGSRNDAADLGAKLTAANIDLATTKKDRQALLDEVNELKTKAVASAETQVQLTGQVDALTKAKHGIENSLKTQIANLEKATKAADDAKIAVEENLKQVSAAGAAKEKELTATINAAKKDLETRKQEIAKLTNDIGDLTKAKSEVEKELKSSIDALQKAREEASKLKSHLDQSEKSKSDLQKKIDELQKALEEKEAEAEKANETEEAAKEEVSALDRQNTQLKSSLTKSQVALTEFKKVIDQAQPVQQDNTVASAAALREEDLLQQLKQERQDRQEITEFLKQLQRKVRQIQGELVDAQSANL